MARPIFRGPLAALALASLFVAAECGSEGNFLAAKTTEQPGASSETDESSRFDIGPLEITYNPKEAQCSEDLLQQDVCTDAALRWLRLRSECHETPCLSQEEVEQCCSEKLRIAIKEMPPATKAAWLIGILIVLCCCPLFLCCCCWSCCCRRPGKRHMRR